jgi:hypothetical protein
MVECWEALKLKFVPEFQEKFWEEEGFLQVVGRDGIRSLEGSLLKEGLEVECVTFEDEGAEGLTRHLLDISSLVVYGEPFNTQRRGGLEGVFVGLFARLVCGGELPTFVEIGVILGCRFLKVRVDMLNGEVGASFLHSYPKECYGTAIRFAHQCSC